jgi:hypothetical protein
MGKDYWFNCNKCDKPTSAYRRRECCRCSIGICDNCWTRKGPKCDRNLKGDYGYYNDEDVYKVNVCKDCYANPYDEIEKKQEINDFLDQVRKLKKLLK